MKGVLLLVFGLLMNTAWAAKGDTVNSVQEIVGFGDMSKSQIYKNSRQWVATSFKSAQNVIQMEDKEEGIIVLKGQADYPCYPDSDGMTTFRCLGYTDASIKFTLKIETKDGRARLSFDDLATYFPQKCSDSICTPETTMAIENRNAKTDTVSQVKRYLQGVIADYYKKVVKNNNDEW